MIRFDTLPTKRLLLYILILLALLPLSALFWSYLKVSKAKELKINIERLTDEVVIKEKKEALNKSVIASSQNADKFFIDKELETLLFLKEEIDALSKLLSEPNLAENDLYAARLELLKSKNSLAFSESNVQSYPGFTETLETLMKPVEMSSSDIAKLLGIIEGTGSAEKRALQKPQLIITEFKLDKKEQPSGNEVFQVNLKLLKREFNS